MSHHIRPPQKSASRCKWGRLGFRGRLYDIRIHAYHAFETNISVNGGTNQNVPLQAAPTNTIQFVLGLHSTDQVNKTVPLKKDPNQQ